MNGSLQRNAGRDEGQPAIHAFIHTRAVAATVRVSLGCGRRLL
jgi:hypothetical protein